MKIRISYWICAIIALISIALHKPYEPFVAAMFILIAMERD